MIALVGGSAVLGTGRFSGKNNTSVNTQMKDTQSVCYIAAVRYRQL